MQNILKVNKLVWGLLIVAVLTLMGCAESSAPSHEDMVNYNGEWIPREEYIQIKDNPQENETQTAPSLQPASEPKPSPQPASEPKPPPQPAPEPKPEPELEVSAKFRIKNWQQDYDDYFEEWSDYVYVYYEIENTGDVDINYYEVYFIAECEGGKEYYDWTNGLDVRAGDKVTGYTMIGVNGKEVRDVAIDDWELTVY